MASEHKQYKLLVDEDERNPLAPTTTNRDSSSTLTNKTLVFLLILSSLGHLVWPVIWALHIQDGPNRTCNPEVSPYASLTYDVPIPFHDVSTFVHHNNVVADATWDSWVVEPGIIALPHSYVNGKMLPQAQNSPLDDSKGVYILSSYHSLHCLKQLRDSFIRASTSTPGLDDNNMTLDHNLHCFDFLRQDIICHADDTPRYTGLSKGEHPGMMQTRMCRSWDKMEHWARSHTACFRDMKQDVEGFPVLNHTTLCPNGYVYSSDGSPIPPWVTGLGVLHPGQK